MKQKGRREDGQKVCSTQYRDEGRMDRVLVVHGTGMRQEEGRLGGIHKRRRYGEKER